MYQQGIFMRLFTRAIFGVLVFLSGAAIADPITIRIGSPSLGGNFTPSGGISLATFIDARNLLQEEFAKDGIAVEWTFFNGAGRAINEAFANNQLDFAYLGDLAAIIGRANGLDTKFLVPTRGNNSYLAVGTDSKVGKLEDLKGKGIAVFMGTAFQLSLNRTLAYAGISVRDLRIINLDWNAASAALATRQIDAAWGGVDLLSLQEKGLAKIIFSARDLGRENTFTSGFVGRGAFISANPDVAQRLVNVLVHTQYRLSQPAHQEEFFTVTSERSGIPLALAHAEFDGDGMAFRGSPRIDDFVLANLRRSVDQAKELGLIRNAYDVRNWVEPRFVEQAIVDLKIEEAWPPYDQLGRPAGK